MNGSGQGRALQNGGRSLPAENREVIALPELLQGMMLHPLDVRKADFRNPNGVGRKTADIATALPGYAGRPTNGGRSNDPYEAGLAHQAELREIMRAQAEGQRR
jgi:hypothetical protein